MPSGAPGGSGTPHVKLKGLVAKFGDSESFGQNTGRQVASAERLAALLRERLPPHEAESILAYFEKQEKRRAQLEQQLAAGKKAPARPQKRRAARQVRKKKVAAKKPEPVPVRRVQVSREDSVRAWYDADLSKFLLNHEIRKAGIVCVLEGLSRWKAHDSYVVQLRLRNKTKTDFFVRDIYVSDGKKRLRADRYFELFVGPGMSKTALVAFARPRSGANVQIGVQEDGDGGRLLVDRIDYPF